jgi:DNA-binding NtrC family response regulator
VPPLGAGFSLDEHLRSIEGKLLTASLQQAKGDRAEAANLLGITPRSLRYLLAKHREGAEGQGT